MKHFHTTDEELDALHQALDRTRTTSATLKVDRQALANLLLDHAAYARKLSEDAL